MNKKKHLIFLTHDPGGLDVVYPVYDLYNKEEKDECELWKTGPSAQLGQYGTKFDEDEVLACLRNNIDPENTILVTGTSWNSLIETDAIHICKNQGVKTISILDYWTNYIERFMNRGEYIIPDYYFVMDDIAKMDAIKCGINCNIIRVVGHPGMDKYISARNKNIHNRTKAYDIENVLFLSQPINASRGGTLGYDENIVISDLIDASQKIGFKLSILFHPKDSNWIKEKYRDYGVNGEGRSMVDVVKDYDTVIGMFTIGILQCYLLGAKVISYQPGLCNSDLCIANRLGVTSGIYSYDDLLNLLMNGFINEDIAEEPIWFDGRSTYRAVKEIKKICGSLY